MNRLLRLRYGFEHAANATAVTLGLLWADQTDEEQADIVRGDPALLAFAWNLTCTQYTVNTILHYEEVTANKTGGFYKSLSYASCSQADFDRLALEETCIAIGTLPMDVDTLHGPAAIAVRCLPVGCSHMRFVC